VNEAMHGMINQLCRTDVIRRYDFFFVLDRYALIANLQNLRLEVTVVQVIVAVPLLGDKQAFSARFTTKLEASTWIG